MANDIILKLGTYDSATQKKGLQREKIKNGLSLTKWLTQILGSSTCCDIDITVASVTADTVTGTTVSTNTISEKTAASGVTIDSVLLKDGKVTPDGGTVSQGTNITTGVTINKPAGVITTQAASAAADAAHTFTVTNSAVTATSNIVATIIDYSGTIGTHGNPTILIDSVGSGSFNIIVFNAHSANALNGTLKIAFAVFK